MIFLYEPLQDWCCILSSILPTKAACKISAGKNFSCITKTSHRRRKILKVGEAKLMPQESQDCVKYNVHTPDVNKNVFCIFYYL